MADVPFSELLLLLLLAAATQSAPPTPTAPPSGQVSEQIRVERVVLRGRVIDRFANRIDGLSKQDFRVLVDGKEVPIEAVDSMSPEETAGAGAPTVAVGESQTASTTDPGQDRGALHEPPSGRLTVMLFQWEIAGQKDTGFVRMMRLAEKTADAARPDEKIAIFGFGSSLRLLQDFTSDHPSLRRAIEAIRAIGYRGRPADPGGPSLSAGIAACGSRDSISKAITCIGSSLQALPGQKNLIFYGWMVGRPKEGPWFVEYPAMIEAVTRADAAVYVLDVSDYGHTLQTGLEQLAADTGGLFNGGCVYGMIYCADLAVRKTQRILAGGEYEIVFADPGLARGWHQVEVELIGRPGIPVFRRWYQD